jgi:hypothetical protein
MGTPAPIQVPSNFSNIKTQADVLRFLSSFSSDVATQFNTLIANKELYGAVGISGAVGITGSGNFSPSLISTGLYWVAYREPFKLSPSVFLTSGAASTIISMGSTGTGFLATVQNLAGTLVNSNFNFLVKGQR